MEKSYAELKSAFSVLADAQASYKVAAEAMRARIESERLALGHEKALNSMVDLVIIGK